MKHLLIYSPLVLACLTPLVAATAQTPSCPGGRASTAVQENTWVEPHARDVVVRHVVKALTILGYSFADTSGPLVTVPRFSWPTSVVFTQWRGLVYPGTTLTIDVQPTGPWTRVRLETRLLCETGQRPPPGHSQDVDFQKFVVSQTQSEAWSAIGSLLHDVKVRSFAESCAPLEDGDLKIDVCRQMAQAQPRNPDALRQYVLALARFYRARDAWKPLNELIALEGERPTTYGEVGAAMLHANEFDDARKLYERATVLWPADPTMPYHLGRAHLGLHAFGPAVDAFTVAVRLDSSLADAHTYAAVALANWADWTSHDDTVRSPRATSRPLWQNESQRPMHGWAWRIAPALSHTTEKRCRTSRGPSRSTRPARGRLPSWWT